MAMLLATAALPAAAQAPAAQASPGQPLPAPAAAQAPAATAPTQVEPEHPEDESDDTVAELVVMGTRTQPGAAIGDFKAELTLSPAQIQSYGVSSVADLLSELSPQLSSSQGRGGGQPVVLLNGRRISGFQEIRDIPTEAIVRMDVLPEEAALAYGYAADQRVVNIVLRRRFRAITTEVTGAGPTQGGNATGTVEINRMQIQGDNRLNLVLKAQVASAVTEDERTVGGNRSSQPFDLTGNITGAVRNGEIDPALNALAGRSVTVAGLPASAATSGNLALRDLAATAGVANVSDVGEFRTLVPKTETLTGNAVLARALPNEYRATVTANFSASRSESLRGLPGASLLIPEANAFSPFSTDVTLNRYLTNFGPLQQTNESWSGGIGGSLNKDLDKWRLALTGTYDHSVSLTHSDVGADISALQAAVNAGTAGSPFGAWSPGLIVARGRDKAQSVTDGINVQAVASGPIFDAPAGAVRTSFKLGEAASWLSSDSLRSGVERDADLSRNTLSAQGSIDLPLTSVQRDVLAFAGDLSVNANVAVNELSDFGTLTTLGFGANWRPTTKLSLIVSHSIDDGAPTMAQLGGPLVTTEAARLFDYATGRTVEVRRLDGGNAALGGDERQVTKVGLTFKPVTGQDLTLSANYVRSRIDNPIATFPAATAEIEAAFPDRFLRNAAGELIQVDYRPVNFAESRSENLRWGFNYSRPFGPQPQPRRFGQGGQGQGSQGQGGQGAQGGQGQRSQGQRSQGQVAQAPGGGPDAPGGEPVIVRDGAPRDTTAPTATPGSERPAGGEGQGPGGGDGPRFGPGGPPGGPGGRGFGPGGPGGMGGRLQFALYHTVHFEDEILVRDGGPVFDLLNGSAAGNSGGQPRHEVEAQAGISRNGMGARLSATWQSATTVDAPITSQTGDLRFGSVLRTDLRLFANLGANRDLVTKYPFFRGSRVSFSVTNLFDERQKVTDMTGATPVGYLPDELDPTGRVVRLSFRKLFF